MPNRILDLRLFQYALASAENGSFRRAAAALNVQQSTVSRGVRSLEHRLGAELFERGHAGIRPTSAGDRFLQEATQGIEHLERAMQRAGAMQRGEHGELTVGVSLPFILLADLFERFRKEFGGVSVEIVESTTSGSWTLVQQRKVDVAFVAKTRGHGAPRSLHLRDERMIAVLPKSHPSAGARMLDLEELRLERFILSTGGLGPDIDDHLVRQMAKWGAEPNIQLQRVGQCNLINMVAKGFGATIVVGPLPRAAPDIVLVPLTDRNSVSLYAVWMESNPNPALKGLLDIVRGSGPLGGVP
ncbi:LysR family transcriptional regulator [Mesorhizobium sp. DCY119]|uniref:LysR family transcriptional regulator n=1 Tax=Mesorhizobium sp. DCY119 TaxID=2108445 RepID=UPI0013C522D1|nr:LysR family transcriptional regulator [Mesorhizobium sp. DCY119]